MRIWLGMVAVLVAALAAFELAMQPEAGDRAAFLVILVSIAAATAAAVWVLPRVTARFRTLRHTVLLVALAAVLVVAVAVGISARMMFLSSHDLRLVIIALGLGVVLGALLAATVSRPLSADLEALAAAAARVGQGDLTVRSHLSRPDEVGAVAAAMDGMIAGLEQAREERERLDRSRRAFLAAVGHDLRTPLTSLRAAVEALQDGVADDPDRYLRSMVADLDLLRGLVEDLFLLSRIEAGELRLPYEPFDLADVADEAVEAMTPVARRRAIDLGISVGRHVTVMGDARELGRVIRNLLDNAIRHAPDQTVVRVEVGGGDSSATVRVVDEGPGFPADLDVFAGFVKGDEARSRVHGGAGLGLAIARGLVEAHGGAIWIEPGPGGRVAFRVPVASREPETAG